MKEHIAYIAITLCMIASACCIQEPRHDIVNDVEHLALDLIEVEL